LRVNTCLWIVLRDTDLFFENNQQAVSIRSGTGSASAMLKRLSAYPRQNGLAVALREIGRIERSLFTMDRLKSPELRRRTHAGLNKGEARNALARAIFFHSLGERRDRAFENQFFRGSGLNLLVAAVILWNTKYLERDLGRAPASATCHPTRDAAWLGAHQPNLGPIQNAFFLRSISCQIIGVKMSCIANAIFPPGHTIVLARDMKLSCSIESR
jgi:Tn3 transposase DDE domain